MASERGAKLVPHLRRSGFIFAFFPALPARRAKFYAVPPALRRWHLGLQLDSVWIAGLLMGFVKLSSGEASACGLH